MTEPAINKAAREAAEHGQRRDLADTGCPGLRLRLTPAGSKTWVLACRDREGRMRRFPLGSFPDKGISEARDEARALRTKVKHEGADPVAQRRRERSIGKAAKEGIGTLQALLDLYGKQRGAELRSWDEAKRRIEVVFKPFLARPLAMLRSADLQMTADGYSAKHAAAAGVRYLRPILKWAAAPGRAYAPPDLASLYPPVTVRRRDRVLARDELAALLPVLRKSDRPYAAALRFMLLTLARREEVGRARWRDIDMDAGTWTIPGEQSKNGQSHVVPLAPQALELLRTRMPDKPKPAALVFATGTGAALGNWDRETKALQEDSKTAGWTRHDLRRTGATMLGEMGELPDIIEAALNHVSIRSPLAATYNRSRYRPQVAVALQRLADVLDGIEMGAGAVVPLRRPPAGWSGRRDHDLNRAG
ncbi:tyrosine-type recombinase/integrase [Limobrevibacterium gyesilva]|uniref:tyrosine-type recombinase/integrase n=1 Tax=Limobrevibacterium gyesilva TaxID=2991712 RepID=UPI0022276306|nr:site-specific integrase [Limobrevibacterium gyesilva]